MSRRHLVATVLTVLTAGWAAGAASAGAPVIVRESFTDSFTDDFLTAECGVPVTTTLQGRVTTRTFDRDGTGPLEVFTINVSLVARSAEGVFRFRDVGADVTRRTATGATTILIAGQVPFVFKGSQLVDAVTGQVLRAARRTVDSGRACAALTA